MIYYTQIELTMLVTASFTSSIRDSETISTKVACRDDEKKQQQQLKLAFNKLNYTEQNYTCTGAHNYINIDILAYLTHISAEDVQAF